MNYIKEDLKITHITTKGSDTGYVKGFGDYLNSIGVETEIKRVLNLESLLEENSGLENWSDITFIDISMKDFAKMRTRLDYLSKNGVIATSDIVWLLDEKSNISSLQIFYKQLVHGSSADFCFVKNETSYINLLDVIDGMGHLELSPGERVDHVKKDVLVQSKGRIHLFGKGSLQIESALNFPIGEKVNIDSTLFPEGSLECVVASKVRSNSRSDYSSSYIVVPSSENKAIYDAALQKAVHLKSNPKKFVRFLSLSSDPFIGVKVDPRIDYSTENDPENYVSAIIQSLPTVLSIWIEDMTNSEDLNFFLDIMSIVRNTCPQCLVILNTSKEFDVSYVTEKTKKTFNAFVTKEYDFSTIQTYVVKNFVEKINDSTGLKDILFSSDRNGTSSCFIEFKATVESLTDGGLDLLSNVRGLTGETFQIKGSQRRLPPIKVLSVNNNNGIITAKGYWEMFSHIPDFSDTLAVLDQIERDSL